MTITAPEANQTFSGRSKLKARIKRDAVESDRNCCEEVSCRGSVETVSEYMLGVARKVAIVRGELILFGMPRFYLHRRNSYRPY